MSPLPYTLSFNSKVVITLKFQGQRPTLQGNDEARLLNKSN